MANRTPGQIQDWLDANSHRFDLSSQFLGDEPNAARRDWDTASARWCMVASWPYQAAAGNQSIPAVYKSIHVYDEAFLCDRFYLPATPRDLKLFEKHDVPVFGIESKHQLRDFDVVATSVAYPVLVMSFHKMLTMSDIPVRWRDRAENPGDYPMIMMGGLAYSAPEVMAPIADVIFCGEAEDEPGNPGIGAVTARIAEYKVVGLWRSDRIECYRRLALEFNFLYFPRFIDVHYGYEDRSHVGVGIPEDVSGDIVPSKQVSGYTSNLEGMRLPILKRHVRVLDSIPPLDDAPLLYGDPQLGAGGLEAGRGCPAWCSFCHLSYATKPYRQHGVEYMTKYAKALQQNSGAARFSPYMPDFPMYTERKNMIREILEQVSDEVDAAAMRVDDFNADKEFILLQVHGGMSGVTLGLEGGSARMRDLVGKGTSDSDVEEAVYSGIRAGIRRFKIFMISNLPGEDEGDIFRVLRLARKLADIRDNLNQPQVAIQFSWTPLLIEAGTPFQWFAVTSNNLALRDVWDEFRELKINFKIGGKVEVNKVSFFQLCQRASREVGEAMVDTMDELGVACWGGVPKNTRELLEKNLRKWGFHNGLEDCFDERFKSDMFGWEFIDSGISSELLWSTYQQMREFVEQTESHNYDDHFDENYHGGEWVQRCDVACLGKSCGVCSAEDLKERVGYIRAELKDKPIDLSTLQVIDQKSVSFKIRAKIHVAPKYRFVENDHWRFSVRRAAFRAATALGFDRNHGISKRTLKFISDEISYKNWTCGVDYVEFGMTRRMSPASVQTFIDRMNVEMEIPNANGERWLSFEDWTMHPAVSRSVRTDVDLSLFEMELPGDPAQTLLKMAEWDRTDYVKLLLKKEGAYFNPQPEEVNAKDYVDGMWIVRDGHRIKIRMLTRGKPTMYILYAAMMGQSSWLSLTAYPVVRIDSFVEVDKHQQDILRPSCVDCEDQIPTTVLDHAYDPDRCPRCRDVHDGLLVTRELVS